MCGLAGIISSDPEIANLSVIQQMNRVLAHRGPDDDSSWSNPSHHVLFGHRRLSIIDLTDTGRQAMHYRDRYTIIYNGEIYNYLEIKEQLQKRGYTFHTHSDTEVILAAFDYYKEDCLVHFDGMFAFAIWDEQRQSLFAARDRFGEKPFYYFYDNVTKILCFASEIKAIQAAGFKTSIDPQQLLMYVALGYTEDPSDKAKTFFTDIIQLPPAYFLRFDLPGFELTTTRYWTLDKDRRIEISESNAIETFNDLFARSVSRRLRSDVPVGTSLSGGVDSSAITAMINEQAGVHVTRKTFSAVFPGFVKDESAHIQRVTEYFNLENYSVTPTAAEFVNDLDVLLYYHEVPVSSASVYIQFRVFELAKRYGIKVLLDGQGADEVLGGYTKYIHWYLQELLHQNKISAFSDEKKALVQNNVPFTWTWKNYAAAKLTRLSSAQLSNREMRTLKRNYDIDADFLLEHQNGTIIHKPQVSKLNDILFFNTCGTGLSELLRYADRNSMAHGREVRLPFLSHELVEFIFSLPSAFKIHDGWTKWILRKAVEKKLPHETVFRKDKIGFEPPQKSWMENELVQDRIYQSKNNLVKNRILKPSVLDKKNQPHEAYAADSRDWRYLIAGQLVK